MAADGAAEEEGEADVVVGAEAPRGPEEGFPRRQVHLVRHLDRLRVLDPAAVPLPRPLPGPRVREPAVKPPGQAARHPRVP